MIRYSISQGDLERRVDALSPSWRRRAADATDALRRKGRYEEPAPKLWSEVKRIFMDLQHNKCAYCERKLSSGSIEHDLEHFRPKGRVDAWPASAHRDEFQHLRYEFDTGDGTSQGYYLLAYHLLNYAVACKECNSRKSDFFPVAGQRAANAGDPASLQAEQSFLIYPIGDLDQDPRDLITFRGIIPSPASQVDGHMNRRARVTIDLLGLEARDDLKWERSHIIYGLWMALEHGEQHYVEVLRREDNRQSSCANAFHQLYASDRPLAEQHARQALKYLQSLSPSSKQYLEKRPDGQGAV